MPAMAWGFDSPLGHFFLFFFLLIFSFTLLILLHSFRFTLPLIMFLPVCSFHSLREHPFLIS